MKVSVIIPNYNHARFLKQRIESVLQQTYTDFELILLDDCSTDNSAEIINSYRSRPHVSHIVFNKKNSGSTFKQWEKGVALAKGEYVWIAESDDYADVHFLKTAIKTLEANKQAGLFFSDYNVVNDEDILITPKLTYKEGLARYFETRETMSGKTFAEEYLFIDNWLVNASAVVFRKSLFLSAGSSYLDYKIVGDWRMWIDICLQTDVIFCNRKLNFFRCHAGTVRSKRTPILAAESISIYRYVLNKTSSSGTKTFLKNRMCELWFKSIEANKKFRLNLRLVKDVLITDPLFFIRACRMIAKNAYLKFK